MHKLSNHAFSFKYMSIGYKQSLTFYLSGKNGTFSTTFPYSEERNDLSSRPKTEVLLEGTFRQWMSHRRAGDSEHRTTIMWAAYVPELSIDDWQPTKTLSWCSLGDWCPVYRQIPWSNANCRVTQKKTGCRPVSQKCATMCLLFVALLKADRFSDSFAFKLFSKFAIKSSQKFQPHVKRITTLLDKTLYT